MIEDGKPMPADVATPGEGDQRSASNKALSPAAERALAEAQARRKAVDDENRPREIDGRGGLDPVRYGDWEVKGLTSDF